MGHRKTRRIYDKSLTYEKLHEAWRTVSHTCKNRRGVFEFAMFSYVRVAKMLKVLRERKYWPNRFRCFMIFEPKPRLVMSQSIRDKAVNHFITNEYLIPLLGPSLIDGNVATRKELGASYAMKLIKRYFSQMMAERPGAKIYALKIDIAKYFYTIDHKILFELLKRRIKDKDLLEILRRIICETDKSYINKMVDYLNHKYGTEIPHYEKGKGLSIGAVTSQFLAIYYLNDLDHYIKEDLKCRFYVRYMDDFLILGWDKAELQRLKKIIEDELAKLELKMNEKSAVYNCCSETGFPFLGYRYYVVNGKLQIVCLAKTVRRIKRRLKVLFEHDYEKYLRSYEAYRGYFLNAHPARRIEEVVGKKA